ncbi:hypothetical protein PCLA_01f0543 [Pseudomonas citronellolis]|nr:hypothetical protein PCLA_01f0543 [Pseudomonas citronellolis]
MKKPRHAGLFLATATAVGRITIRGYPPLAVPPRRLQSSGRHGVFPVGASLLANGVCRWRRCRAQEHPLPSPLPEGRGGCSEWVGSSESSWNAQSSPSFPRTRESSDCGVREQARSYEKQKRVCSWTSRETSERTETPLQKAERSPRSGGHATWMSREPRELQGRTLGAGLRGGGVREGSPTLSGPYAGQAFLVPFCGGGLPPFDKRDSPEGAKREIPEHSERRATPSPPKSLWVPALAGMTRLSIVAALRRRNAAVGWVERSDTHRHDRIVFARPLGAPGKATAPTDQPACRRTIETARA